MSAARDASKYHTYYYNTTRDHYNTTRDHYNTTTDHYNSTRDHYNRPPKHYKWQWTIVPCSGPGLIVATGGNTYKSESSKCVV